MLLGPTMFVCCFLGELKKMLAYPGCPTFTAPPAFDNGAAVWRRRGACSSERTQQMAPHTRGSWPPCTRTLARKERGVPSSEGTKTLGDSSDGVKPNAASYRTLAPPPGRPSSSLLLPGDTKLWVFCVCVHCKDSPHLSSKSNTLRTQAP